MKFCNQCGAQLEDDMLFCNMCGAKQEAAPAAPEAAPAKCPKCGYTPADGILPKFCPECGNKNE